MAPARRVAVCGVGALEGRDIDDGAATLAPRARGSLRDEERAVVIRDQYRAQIFVAHVGQRLDGLRRGIVDHHSRPTGLEHRVDGCRSPAIRLDDALGADGAGEACGRCLVALVVHDDLRPGLGEARGNAATDIAAGARDENRLAREAQQLTNVGYRGHAVLRQVNRAIVP